MLRVLEDIQDGNSRISGKMRIPTKKEGGITKPWMTGFIDRMMRHKGSLLPIRNHDKHRKFDVKREIRIANREY